MYSLEFAAHVSRLCMDEILSRGLTERKILRKSVPNSVLLLKVFRKQQCTAEDLVHVSIHSVATLMQDTLWCCQERIVSRKVWRTINYETCTLEELSKYTSKRGIQLLIEILDFLIEIKRYKAHNLMDAYHLGEAMGKVTLGPSDCDPIMADKASHFLTRMIIERSKQQPMIKSEATKAKAKSYYRIIQGIHRRNFDWLSVVHVALYAMMEDEYEPETPRPQEPYISIFAKLDPSNRALSPVLFRLLTYQPEPVLQVSLEDSLKRNHVIEDQIKSAFDDFVPLLEKSTHTTYHEATASKAKVHNSLSQIKLNLKKNKQYQRSSEDTMYERSYADKPNQVKSMMRKMIKITPINHNKMLSAFQ
ncbi:hypothetical protein G6F57_012317 [Rhizopus arrhizus]|nr:hypothetical protein G6F23_011073 [Rhizopus arrhizus]KAG1417816.1 hypothetical protein G6F58_005337 [Rhizopus delemar]KAG0759719.1 hypothetical protein G6F24_008866 [Rhizopus arrhizus]KAG0778926.1 hypothetical protein G6F22_010939 [Rhizopus arrhizus]KAG0780159.1 hypothetical protein G6F21_012259 [Rhizopus arrhizus]